MTATRANWAGGTSSRNRGLTGAAAAMNSSRDFTLSLVEDYLISDSAKSQNLLKRA
jgi:hypothetical protein